MATSFEMTDDGGIRVRRGAASISRFEAEEVAELRALLSIPGLTPEEVQVALAERELEQARVEGVISSWTHWRGHEGHQYTLSWPVRGWHSHLPQRSQLAAAQAAVARVRELRAEAKKKKVPEPETMTIEAMRDELWALGWCMGCDCLRCFIWQEGDGTTKVTQGSDETPIEVYTRALRRARALDQA